MNPECKLIIHPHVMQVNKGDGLITIAEER